MSSKMSHNHYEVMYVEPSCTRDEIHKQYKYLALVWHPDKKRVNLYATVQLQELNETHRVLDNPNKRALYDQLLGYVADICARNFVSEESSHGHGAQDPHSRKDCSKLPLGSNKFDAEPK
ncbi:hypothetical protein BKA67DRAFT_538132 [Truncatella angustata]|uniref:J domain-containing protein n=1 Tax=Truncatella angustata TaxID=152316 RepID=A0A9P8UH82_9PEZI|nr:uncharacterized protein BKA67DRAFT_538132 [Truncatella angustata]KAH6652312.1 hypothetical protein BKA67DRAFT_538132 [Truncatella angustata]